MAPRCLSSSRVATLRRKYSITRCRCAALSAPSGVWGSSTTIRLPPLPVTAAPTEVASIRPRWAFQYSLASVGCVNDTRGPQCLQYQGDCNRVRRSWECCPASDSA